MLIHLLLQVQGPFTRHDHIEWRISMKANPNWPMITPTKKLCLQEKRALDKDFTPLWRLFKLVSYTPSGTRTHDLTLMDKE